MVRNSRRVGKGENRYSFWEKFNVSCMSCVPEVIEGSSKHTIAILRESSAYGRPDAPNRTLYVLKKFNHEPIRTYLVMSRTAQKR